MARKAFYSFHYDNDNWRASQVRNIGAIEGNSPCTDNDWETVTKGGDAAIAKWIAGQLQGRSCTVVLVGEGTAGRKWITHEIIESWNAKMGIVGIRIHNLLNRHQKQSAKGGNPFDFVTFGADKKALSTVVKLYDPPHSESTKCYSHIKDNLAEWVEEAIRIRNAN